MKTKQAGFTADIALLLEGTYPYVRGGVSSWVHDIVKGLPEYSFQLLFLGASRKSYGPMGYTLPGNVAGLEEHYLMDQDEVIPPSQRSGNAEAFATFDNLHDYFRNPAKGLQDESLKEAFAALNNRKGVTYADFLYSKASWESIKGSYSKFCYDPSFLEYFWTIRSMHFPIFKIARIAESAPRARLYHAISTGYAGFLGTLLNRKRGAPFILTEHGNYTKERKIDLASADWINDPYAGYGGDIGHEISYIRRLWIRFFEGLGRLAYEAADPIIAIYEKNRQRQVEGGADPDRTRVIRNGIDLDRFEKIRERRLDRIPLRLGLIGRVVSIKDIKTFIRAMRTVCNRLPEAEGWVIGPEEEDPTYVEDCKNLVVRLGLGGQVKFLGFQKVEDIYPQLGLLVLTSISEAMPLVLLEGFACGVPGLTTDVGSCREIIEGSDPEDKALGKAGAVVPIADAEAFAREAISLLTDEDRWRAAREAGILRVQKYFTKETLLDSYRAIYNEALKGADGGHRI